MRRAAAPYLLALALGAGLAGALFPMDFLLPRGGMAWRAEADAAQHAIAQRHFLADAWRWPPLEVSTLGGVNLAFMDGIPALALALRLLPGLPEGFHGIGLFYGLAWALQPVAAVFALRGFGVRGLPASVSVAVMAVSTPAFIMRFGHAALCGQFVILAALGLYARAIRDPRWWFAAAPFQVLALLVHPYLALMALAVLAAAPLTLLLRGERIGAAALGVTVAAGAMGLAMAALGYLGAEGEGGFGRFAMNLLAPAWPHRSQFLGFLVDRDIDATREGGWEGFNWLGLGLWLALGAALLAGRKPRPWRHAGLLLALGALAALAVSSRVGLGWHVVLDLGPVPGILEQFRASGRFFWPVAYALLLFAAVSLARGGRRGIALLAVCAVVQFLDAAPSRAALRHWAAAHQPWSVDAAALRPLLGAAARHSVVPSWECTSWADWPTRSRVIEVLLLASETPRPVNTVYAARWRTPPRCAAPGPLLPGELRLVLPGHDPRAEGCRPVGGLLACGP